MTITSSPRQADRPAPITKRGAQNSLDAVGPATSETAALAPVTPDLAAQGRDLAPIFPLDASGTGVVLYVGSPGLMRVHWFLERDDFEQAAASFPVSGRRPAAVLRLRRERPGGGADLVDERPLGAGARDGTGESGFAVPTDHGLYRAELGLTDGEGGWLMLARSNGHYNAVGVGLNLPAPSPGGQPGQDSDPVPESPGTPVEVASAVTGQDGAEPRVTVAEPALSASAPGPAGWNFPLAPVVRSLLRVPASGADPMQGGGASGKDGVAAVSVCADGGALGGPAVAALNAVPVQSLVEALAGVPAARSSGASVTQGPGANRLATADGTVAGSEGGIERALPGVRVRIEPLTYERPTSRTTGLELEAELRIHGRAEPNSTIDLFGFSYRVGPGGRFLLTLRVEDPDLLRRALEAAPPPELAPGRDG